MGLHLGIDLSLTGLVARQGGDATPGGAADVILLESGDGILLEDGSSFIELE